MNHDCLTVCPAICNSIGRNIHFFGRQNLDKLWVISGNVEHKLPHYSRYKHTFLLTLFVPRVRSPSLHPTFFYFMYCTIFGEMPGFEPEMLRQQPGVLPKSYTYIKTSTVVVVHCYQSYVSLTLITPAPVCANMIHSLVHTCRGLGFSIFIEMNVKRQSNPWALKVFKIQHCSAHIQPSTITSKYHFKMCVPFRHNSRGN